MAIIVDEKNKIFNLQTKNTSYVFCVYKNTELVHIHYGKKIKRVMNLEENIFFGTGPGFFGERDVENSKVQSEMLLSEYSYYGHPDDRTPSFHAEYADGSSVTEWEYVGYNVSKGKKKLSGLPATYVEADTEADTLEIIMKDSKTGLEFILQYTAFNDLDVIARNVKIINAGNEDVNLKRVMSACIPFKHMDFDFYSFNGSWAKERHLEKRSLGHGYCGVDSKRGSSSHISNPFITLASKNADERIGDVYGFSLVYSGNFIAEASVDSNDFTSVMLGINPFDFNWKLCPGEEFQTPEALAVYSQNGFGDMSRTYHKLFRTRLCRGKYRDCERPVLINNWEATYFGFNEQKIVDIAKKAKEIGVDLMVLDDGWFGKRDDDTTSLGDWYVDKNKLPNGVGGLADKINALGMKFGIWVEPEMVSPDSDLYRAHPDWCLHVPGRNRSLGRNQCILDYSRPEVCEYIINILSELFSSANISYVKWDMNRNMTEIGSLTQSADRQRETAHRYMLGLYYVLETLTSRFPDILFEGCSGGGGRFDPGMLYYSPQIWTSDDSDGIERLFIQEGTSFVYPPSAMGAHVSAVPNHQIERITDINLRADVALMGQFGFELNLSALTDEELSVAKEKVDFYKQYGSVFHTGYMYRLLSAFESNTVAWEFVSEDKNTVILCLYKILAKPSPASVTIRLQGLDGEAVYEYNEKEFDGDLLMNVGLNTATHLNVLGDFKSKVMVFKKK